MIKSFKYRIYPKNEQLEKIEKTFEAVIFTYNYYLAQRSKLYKANKNPLWNKSNENIALLKNNHPFLKEIDEKILVNTLKELDYAFARFNKKISNYPKPKEKEFRHLSFKIQAEDRNIKISDKYIVLPNIGKIRYRNANKNIEGKILNATISKNASGNYFVSLCTGGSNPKSFKKTGVTIGIDLGIKDFAIDSLGNRYPNPKYLDKSLKKLNNLQRQLRNKKVNSSNFNKIRLKIAKIYEHINNQRKDYFNKLSNELVRKYDVICVEDLDINRLNKDKRFSFNIEDAAWSEFIKILTYKASWYNKKLVKVDRHFPSSKMCSSCGYINREINNANIREWVCPNCGVVHDRDLNAAINIEREGLRMINKISLQDSYLTNKKKDPYEQISLF